MPPISDVVTQVQGRLVLLFAAFLDGRDGDIRVECELQARRRSFAMIAAAETDAGKWAWSSSAKASRLRTLAHAGAWNLIGPAALRK